MRMLTEYDYHRTGPFEVAELHGVCINELSKALSNNNNNRRWVSNWAYENYLEVMKILNSPLYEELK